MMIFLILYVDDILLIGNDVGTLSSVKVWLSTQFDMKDLGEASHILGIKLMRDRQKRMCANYISPFLDLSRHQYLGTSNLTNRSSPMSK